MVTSPSNWPQLSDHDLGVFYAQGIRDAFLELWSRHENEFLRIVGKRLRGCPEQDAEDLMQETKARLLSRYRQYSPDRGLWVRWASVAVKHLCQDFMRKRLRGPHAAALPPGLAAPATALDEGLMGDCEAALAAVPDRSRRVFVERIVHGRSSTEIAKDMKLSNATVSRDLEVATAAVINYLTEHGWRADR